MPLRRVLAGVEPYRPQPPMRELQAALGLERMVKLASNEGAFGPMPAAVAAFEGVAGELNRYPDGGATRLRRALAERHGVAVEQVVVGNGADELIRLCGVATLDAGDRAVFPWPSFPSYVAAAACCAAEPVMVPLSRHRFDAHAVLAACRPGTKLVYLANPNNPTGVLTSHAELAAFLDALPPGILLVLDEAYGDYAEPEPRGVDFVRAGDGRVCVLKTFSKVYGLAALRVGYAIASPEVADTLDRVRNIFNVNQPAQEAALASLHETEAVAGRIAHARRAREFIRGALESAGLDPEPSQANFVYADVPGGDAEGITLRLLERGVMVRALTGFGAPGAIRVTAGTDEENALFAEALHGVIHTSKSA